MHKSKQGDEVKLNMAQQAAVQSREGPVLVVAGAGTGKTRVIVERIKHLADSGVKPTQLLALTFTEKAAAEMVDRVNTALGGYHTELPIMTFNAFGESLLRRYAADIGLSRSFKLIGDTAQLVFLRERLDELQLDYFSPVSNPDGLLKDIADYFSRLKQDVITPEVYLKNAQAMPASEPAEQLDKVKHLELAKAYETYLRLCREASVIDYDDQLYLALELLQKRPNILAEVQTTYQFVMVDEFQDTNRMQSELIDLVAGKEKNIFAVGDDDQSIYGWRGATLSNILEFKNRYPQAQEITLTGNYRSTAEILDSAYRLIQHNNPHRLEAQLHIDKKLISSRHGTDPQVCVFDSLEEEYGWIAEDIKARIAAGAAPGSIAVLARRTATIRDLQTYLSYEGIPHAVAGQRFNLYDEPAVRAILEALRCISDPADNISLYHCLTGPLFDLPAPRLSSLLKTAREEHRALYEVLNESVGEDEALSAAMALIRDWQAKAGTLSVGHTSYEVLDQSGYKDRLYQAATDDPAVAAALSRLSELFRSFRDFERIAIQPSAVQYVSVLPTLMAAGDSQEDGTLELMNDEVNLLTIHRSKGLEWSVVYIADCSEGSFPLRESSRGIALPAELKQLVTSEADAHLPEERRLMYVAMTRARDQLILTHAEHHSTNSSRKPSRFLIEAFGEDKDIRQTSRGRQPSNVNGFAAQETVAELPAGMLKQGQLELTVSQAQCYLDCPLEFYYRYVLGVPEAPSARLAYGSLMHGLIETINRSLLDGQLVPLAELEAELEAQWPKTGFMTPGHRDRSKQQSLQTLRAFYQRSQTGQRVPTAVESSFRFSVPDAALNLKGRFDAILPVGKGVEIVDYKTGTSVDSSEKAKRRATSSTQLTLYALAWRELHGELPALVSLDFIDTGHIGSVKKTARGVDSMQARLADMAEQISALQFTPGKDHTFCSHPAVSK